MHLIKGTIILLSTSVQAWTPPTGLFFAILVLGAFLFAGVGMFAFSFYEDYYWADEEYRKQLRGIPNPAKEKVRT